MATSTTRTAQIALVTGANKGIGFEIARQLARSGMTVYVGPAAVTQAMLPLLRRSPAGRIVNVSSELGSLALNGDPGWEHAPVKLLGYGASKAARTMLTVKLAFALKDTTIKVNSAGPGYTA